MDSLLCQLNFPLRGLEGKGPHVRACWSDRATHGGINLVAWPFISCFWRTLDGWRPLWQGNITRVMWNVKRIMWMHERGLLCICVCLNTSARMTSLCMYVLMRDNKAAGLSSSSLTFPYWTKMWKSVYQCWQPHAAVVFLMSNAF